MACHQFGLLDRFDVLENARHGGTFLLNAPFPADEVWEHLPEIIQREIIERELSVFTIDAARVAAEVGMAGRINTVMQPCYFALSNVMPRDEALTAMKDSITKTYGRRGRLIVEKNHAAIDRSLDELVEVDVPAAATATSSSDDQLAAATASGASEFVERVTMQMMAGKGDLLPVSAMPVDGTFPTGTTQFEKRKLAREIPVWEADLCIDCGKCAIVCPHAAIRMKAYEPDAIDAAPDELQDEVVPLARARRPPADRAGRPRRLHRVRRLRRRLPGEGQDRGQAQVDQHASRLRNTAMSNANGGTSSGRFPNSTAPPCHTTRSRTPSCSNRSSSSRERAPDAARPRTSSCSPSCSVIAW